MCRQALEALRKELIAAQAALAKKHEDVDDGRNIYLNLPE